MQDGLVCFERRNLGCQIVVGPESQGSTSIEKLPGRCWYCGPGGVYGEVSLGEKVRRKVVSPLRCLTVKDMMWDGWMECARGRLFGYKLISCHVMREVEDGVSGRLHDDTK